MTFHILNILSGCLYHYWLIIFDISLSADIWFIVLAILRLLEYDLNKVTENKPETLVSFIISRFLAQIKYSHSYKTHIGELLATLFLHLHKYLYAHKAHKVHT